MVAATDRGADRQPTFVHCGVCAEEWIAAWTPAPVGAMVVEMTKNSACPGCGATGAALIGKAPQIEETPRG